MREWANKVNQWIHSSYLVIYSKDFIKEYSLCSHLGLSRPLVSIWSYSRTPRRICWGLCCDFIHFCPGLLPSFPSRWVSHWDPQENSCIQISATESGSSKPNLRHHSKTQFSQFLKEKTLLTLEGCCEDHKGSTEQKCRSWPLVDVNFFSFLFFTTWTTL